MQDYLGKKSKDITKLEEKYKNGESGIQIRNRLKEAYCDQAIVYLVAKSIFECPPDTYISLSSLATLFGMEPSKLFEVYMENDYLLGDGYSKVMSGEEVRHSGWRYILIKRNVLDREAYKQDQDSDYLETVEAKDAFVMRNDMLYFTTEGIHRIAKFVPQIGVPKVLTHL